VTLALPPPEPKGARIGVLFVCLGNICRSPLAKWIFADAVARTVHAARFEVDSCGTGHWHAGDRADPRSEAIARRYRIEASHVARQLSPMFDFPRFDYFIAMDRSNARRMLDLGAPRARVHLVRAFDPALASSRDEPPEVPDPYTHGEDAFEEVYWMLRAACTGLLDHILRERGLGG
jgi:protein-tyrosine phosphatase